MIFLQTESALHFIGAELICRIGAAQKLGWDTGIIFFEDGAFALADEVDGVDLVIGDLTSDHAQKLVRVLFAFEGHIIATVVFQAVNAEIGGVRLQVFAQSSEGARAEPWEKAFRIAAQRDEHGFFHIGVRKDSACRRKTFLGVGLQVRVIRIGAKDLEHHFQDPCVDLAVIAGPRDLHFAGDGMNVDQLSRQIQFLDLPNSACKREAVTDGWGRGDRADLFAFVLDGIVLAILEDGVEFKAFCQLFAAQTEDQTFVFRHFHVIVFDHGDEKLAVILFIDVGEGGKRENLFGKALGRIFARGGKNAERLLEHKAQGHFLDGRRLYESFFDIELDDGNAADQLPRNELGKGCVGQRLFFAEDHEHFGNARFSAASSEPLQKARDGIGRTDVENALDLSDINAKLQRDRRASDAFLFVLELLLRFLADGGGKVAVMDIKDVLVLAVACDLAKRCSHVFRLLAGVGKDDALFIFDAIVNIFVARVDRNGGLGVFRGGNLSVLSVVLNVEMLDGKAYLVFCGSDGGDLRISAAVARQPLLRLCEVADGCGKPDK